MKITVQRQILCEAVGHISRAAAAKSAIPVLEGIYMSAENGCLYLTAYNLEMGISKTIPATVVQEGKIVISAKLLSEILHRVDGDSIDLSVDDRYMCKIQSRSSVFDIMGMAANDYPEIPSISEADSFSLPSELIKDMVRQTIFAAAKEETSKPIFTGILFELEPGSLSIVAVDGFRLAVRKEALQTDLSARFIVPAKAVAEAVRIISDEADTIKISVGSRHISIELGGYEIISRLLEGEFVNYKNSIPATFSANTKIKTREVTTIIDRISLLINENIKNPIRCVITEDKIIFSCTTALGRATDECAIQLQGEGFEIGFNSRYLVEALKASETDEVVMNFNGPYAPMILKPEQGDEFMYMIMPMRLR